MKPKNRVRLVGLLLLFGVLAAYSAPVSRAVVTDRIYLPFISHTDTMMPTPGVLRIDNRPLSTLDNVLYNFGITDPNIRGRIVAYETARRSGGGGGGSDPDDVYPQPQGTTPGSIPQVWSHYGLGCFQGQACAVVWRGDGVLRGMFREEVLGWTPWSGAFTCPAGQTCTVVNRIGPDNSLPAYKQRRWVLFRSDSLSFPKFVSRDCFYRT